MNLKEETIGASTKWLLELNLLDNEYMKNTIMFNIYKVSTKIKDVQLVIDIESRKMLVYLELTKLGNLFAKKEIGRNVAELLHEALPTYQFRITYSPEVLQKSIDRGILDARRRGD